MGCNPTAVWNSFPSGLINFASVNSRRGWLTHAAVNQIFPEHNTSRPW
jgi:hypothetical protein